MEDETEHVPHAARPPWVKPEPALKPEDWRRMFELLSAPGQPREKILDGGSGCPAGPHYCVHVPGHALRRRVYFPLPEPYDHFALTDPATGEMLDTAGTEALLADIRSNGPKAQRLVTRLKEFLARRRDNEGEE